jgi:hypothetical protein
MRSTLGARRTREHVPANPKPTYVVHRKGSEWGISVLHGGRELYWYSIAECRREGANLISLANLAARPGELPLEELG